VPGATTPPGPQPRSPGEDLATIAFPDAGYGEKLLHDLRITEPAMLTRAELADAAALDLLTQAAGQLCRRDNACGTGQGRRSAGRQGTLHSQRPAPKHTCRAAARRHGLRRAGMLT
jgi:hypothetical protein